MTSSCTFILSGPRGLSLEPCPFLTQHIPKLPTPSLCAVCLAALLMRRFLPAQLETASSLLLNCGQMDTHIHLILAHSYSFVLIPGIVWHAGREPQRYRGLTGFRATQLISAQSKDHVYSCEERLMAKYWACHRCRSIVKDFT